MSTPTAESSAQEAPSLEKLLQDLACIVEALSQLLEGEKNSEYLPQMFGELNESIAGLKLQTSNLTSLLEKPQFEEKSMLAALGAHQKVLTELTMVKDSLQVLQANQEELFRSLNLPYQPPSNNAGR